MGVHGYKDLWTVPMGALAVPEGQRQSPNRQLRRFVCYPACAYLVISALMQLVSEIANAPQRALRLVPS
jgi:hypothetical protein